MASVLDLHHLETLVAILETRSVTAAAKRLGVTQSAASHRLAEAQRRLGGRLFQTNLGRTLRPTPAAVALCQAAQRILPELARAEADFMRAAGTDR
ncbi:MAG: LysR family transcriptional regulator [Ilumatobacteraceae bacterium]|nr:LysR family transcriptional regulator [Ilumatobacteraceae bacterium]